MSRSDPAHTPDPGGLTTHPILPHVPLPRAIIFDAEGVVLDTEDLWDDAQVVFLDRYGVPYERDVLKPILSGRSLLEGAEIMKATFGLPGEPVDLAAERRAIAREVIATGARYMDGFGAFFAQVHNRFATCIATGLDSELLAMVDARLALSEMFAGRLYSVDLVPRAKPAPDIFLYAAGKMGVDTAECVVIEDSPNGIIAAREANMRSIALASTYSTELLEASFPDVIAADWAGVMAALDGDG